MKRYIPLLIICWFLCSSSCKKDPEPEPDPCAGKHPVTADFHIYERLNLAYPDGWQLYDTDTIATDGIIFKALEEGAQYEWRLGRETITTKSFGRNGFPRDAIIFVSLKVTKTPDNDCFPEDSGIVTKTRRFYTTTYEPCQFPALTGRFRGYRSDNPNQPVIVEIDPCYRYPGQDPFDRLTHTRIINLEPGCDTYKFDLFRSYKQIHFAGINIECNKPLGIMRAHATNSDSLTIEYSFYKDFISLERVFKTFKGIRISN